MRTTLSILVALALVAIAGSYSSSRAAPHRETPVREVARHVLARESAPTEDAHHRELKAYVLEAMRAWAPSSTIAQTHSTEAYPSIASDLVDVALDPGEPTLWADDANKTRTATLLATVAYFEGHFWPYVEAGVCNDPKRRSDPVLRNGGCDGGAAYSLWQIHPVHRMVLLDDGLWGRATGDDDRVINGDKLLADRKLAARTALHFLRASIRRDGTLCEYTGERRPVCPKADRRLSFAREWVKLHPG
jgi:hypothetical protein